MSDIHQEWRELRQKNGDFISHLDGEMAKMKKVEQTERTLQDAVDAMRHMCQSGLEKKIEELRKKLAESEAARDTLAKINELHSQRIENLECQKRSLVEQTAALEESIKELNEKLNKVRADYTALYIENNDLKKSNANLRSLAEKANEGYKKVIQREKEAIDICKCYREELKRKNSCIDALNEDIITLKSTQSSPYSVLVQKGMQSKIAKQAAEIRRLTEAKKDLTDTLKQMEALSCSDATDIHNLRNQLRINKEEISKLYLKAAKQSQENKDLREAIDKAANDAEHARKAGYDEGYYVGVNKLWKAIKVANIQMPNALQDAYGYRCMDDVVSNLTGTAFLRKTEEFQTRISIGDEVEICDDGINSDIGIVVAISGKNPDLKVYQIIGQHFEGCIDSTDISNGHLRKTGRHFDAIPTDYFA